MRSPATSLFASLALLFGVFGFARPGLAQEQEQKLMSRILRPNMNLEFKAKDFQATRSYEGKNARARMFPFLSKFWTKDFRQTRHFSGQSGGFMDLRQIDAKEADTKGHDMVRQIVREHSTKAAAVKASWDADKKYDNGGEAGRTYAARTTTFKGRSQDKMDKEGPAALNTIQQGGTFTQLKTVEDIRNLLNKN